MFKDIISLIKPLDTEAMDKCQLRLDNLTKPLGSLHAFEHLARQIAGITGNPKPKNLQKSIILITDDNGESAEKISNISRGEAVINVFAEHVDANIVLVDITRCQALKAVEVGIMAARKEIAKGVRVLGLGELCMGSLEIAGLVGVILGAASGGAAIVLDGYITSIAALIAVNISSRVKDYLIGSHLSVIPAHKIVLDMIGVPAYLHLDISLGGGIGAALGMSLIDASLHVLNDMKTFGEAEVAVAQDGPGALKQTR